MTGRPRECQLDALGEYAAAFCDQHLNVHLAQMATPKQEFQAFNALSGNARLVALDAVSRGLRRHRRMVRQVLWDIGERWTARFGREIIDGIGTTGMLQVFLSSRARVLRSGTAGRPVETCAMALRKQDGYVIAGHDQGGPACRGEWTQTGDQYIRAVES